MDEWFFTNPEHAEPPEEPKKPVSAPVAVPVPDDSGVDSLMAARSFVAANVEKGIACPCCDQFVRLYKRKLNTNMARFLCSLVRLSLRRGRDAWVSFKDCDFDGRDYPYVALWGLAETRSNDDASKKNSGQWKPTQKGIDFVLAGLRVPSHVHVLNNRVVGWSDDTVDVKSALGAAFNYDELME
jgi:hypothetical protein